MSVFINGQQQKSGIRIESWPGCFLGSILKVVENGVKDTDILVTGSCGLLGTALCDILRGNVSVCHAIQVVGLLDRLVPMFRRGQGGVMGYGQQYLSWVALSDVVRAIEFILKQDDLSGPVNVCTPNPVTNREFASALGKALHRPTILPLPSFMIKTLFGEMGQELILASQRVKPRLLLDAGFEFEHAEITGALETLL